MYHHMYQACDKHLHWTFQEVLAFYDFKESKKTLCVPNNILGLKKGNDQDVCSKIRSLPIILGDLVAMT